MKKLIDGYTQSVTKLFDRYNSDVFRSAVYNIVHGGLRNRRDSGQFIDGYVPFVAQSKYSLRNRIRDSHIITS